MKHTNGNPAKIRRNFNIANDRATTGESYIKLAKKYGLSPQQIGNILQDDEIKEVLNEASKQMVSLVPKAVDNVKVILEDKDNPDHYKATQDTLKANGIFSTHAPSPIIVNYQRKTINQLITPVMANIMQYQTDQQLQADNDFDLIDTEYTDDISNSDT